MPQFESDVHSSPITEGQGDKLAQCTAYFAGTVGVYSEKQAEGGGEGEVSLKRWGGI